jgi:deazaflavin-dependent oxidoreductase (nitroreductase family)
MDIRELNKSVIDEFRANGGKVGGAMAGVPLLLLTTVGAKSGQTRVNPLAYLEDGGRYVIIASYAGSPTNPPWYHNLLANPKVTVEVGRERFGADAQVLDEPERSRLYRTMASRLPTFDDYERKTQRRIPVIALRRR